jgi:glucose-1-phosphate adenylyltransferase
MLGNDVLGILFAYVNEKRVSELTTNRVMASVPFGGRYRLVDFPLSNMVNSGINKVGVITEQNYQSLMDHLGSGKAWDLSRKREGLFLLPPFNTDHTRTDGKIESLYSIKRFLINSHEEYVILSDCDYVCNLNYTDALDFHEQTGADMTIIYRQGSVQDGLSTSVYTIDPESRIIDSVVRESGNTNCNIGMGMYIISRKYLIDIIETSMGRNRLDLNRSVIPECIRSAKVMGYEFKGTAYQITSLSAYFDANLALMDPKVRMELFDTSRPIYTKVRDDMPAKYGLGSSVSNSLIADGCVIEGKVENCVLFRGVKIAKDAVVTNCVVMQDSVIGEKCNLNYVILDKNVKVNQERTLAGYKTYPVYIAKESIV